MTINNLAFSIHKQQRAPSYSVPLLEAYQHQKHIKVVSNSTSLCFAAQNSVGEASRSACCDSQAFFDLRLEMALGLSTTTRPSYFPGAIIPGPGGSSCSEVGRGSLLFDQFQYLLEIDAEMLERIGLSGEGPYHSQTNCSKLFMSKPENSEAWLWKFTAEPELFFLHQSPAPIANYRKSKSQAILALAGKAKSLLEHAEVQGFAEPDLIALLSLVSDAWFRPNSGVAPITWGGGAFARAKQALVEHRPLMTEANLLPYLFELEAMASHISLNEKRESFARGVFAGNFIDVAMTPITSIKATEFCVRERLFDEMINLSSRGFAPVVINEYGLVADGNHRLTAAYIWNILKYAQDLDWCLENDDLQKRVAAFPNAVQNGLFRHPGQLSPVSLHQAFNHLAYFLCRPEWRSRLNSLIKPLLKRHDIIHELPVVVLPEYLSGSVVKSKYDDGIAVERACPSLYEAMSLNDNLVLPPRASYHFTDAALLPWFTVLQKSRGTVRRHGALGRRATGVTHIGRRKQT